MRLVYVSLKSLPHLHIIEITTHMVSNPHLQKDGHRPSFLGLVRLLGKMHVVIIIICLGNSFLDSICHEACVKNLYSDTMLGHYERT